MRKKTSPTVQSNGKKPSSSNGSIGSHATATLSRDKNHKGKKKPQVLIDSLNTLTHDPLNSFFDNRELLRVLTEVRAGNSLRECHSIKLD